ncbi:putative nuclease HARBI1 [Carassius carassius]|uniref:putative nuclease HARBI1 n=1 Tax=Carassius carassius TaxID=217509 RepID=UPI002868565B|nr:putative nuclease HARBI1 [Carassius carassius]
MACPFIDEVVDEGAIIIRRAFQRERTFRDRADPLAFSDYYLHERYRFSREGIAYICRLLSPHIANSTGRNKALTVPQTVCIAHRFFASGTFLYTVGDAGNISKASVCRSVRIVYRSLKKLLNVFITFPGHRAIHIPKQAFYGIAAFPNVIGALDFTHVRIKRPSGPHEADFVNRKSLHSINVQMIGDADCIITNVEAKWPGSVHDSRIFRASSLSHQLAQGRKRKGKKTQIMEAMERGINMLIQHDKDTTAAEVEQRLDKEHMAWERQFQQTRLDLERARLEFEMKRQEAEDRCARDIQ